MTYSVYFSLGDGRNRLYEEMPSKYSETTTEKDMSKAEYLSAEPNPPPAKMKYRFSFNK